MPINLPLFAATGIPFSRRKRRTTYVPLDVDQMFRDDVLKSWSPELDKDQEDE